MIPSYQSTNFGWVGMIIRPEIYALSEPNPWKDPTNWGSTPHMGNLIITEAEWKYHHDLWKILKHQHDSFINIGCALHKAIDKAIPDQFEPVQQMGKCGFGNHAALEIVV